MSTSWNGTSPSWSASIFSGHDVADDDLVAELGEARPGDEADPAGAEDAYPGHCAADSTCPEAAA